VVVVTVLSGIGATTSVRSPSAPPSGAGPAIDELAHSSVAGTPTAATCSLQHCGSVALRSASAPAPRTLGSTPTNWYIANWSGEGMIREDPNDPMSLVSGARTYAAAAANDSATYNQSGIIGAFTSRDGGRNWTNGYLPSNPAWWDPNSTLCGHNHGADSAIGFGPGGVVYYVDLVGPSVESVSCPNPLAGVAAYATVSHDGGATWGTPVLIQGNASGASIDKPWIAVDPTTGEAYVAYSDFTDFMNGSSIWIQNSTDDGATWSNRIELSTVHDAAQGAELVVDPWGGVDVTWINDHQGALKIKFVRSVDHGATFSRPVNVGTPATTYSSSSPDGFVAGVLPGFGVDGYAGNAFTGTLFSVWQNGAGSAAGDPTVLLSRSTDNGSTWSAPIHVSSKTTDKDFQPSVAVGSDGAVYVDWYGEDPITGNYRLEAALSTDGGQTFAPEISVSDVDSNPSTSAGPDIWIGDYTDIVGDATGARPLWTDTRSTEGWNGTGVFAPLALYNMSLYTALLVNDSLAASIPVNVSLNGTVGGTGTVGLTPAPSTTLWLVGATYNLTAPSTTTWNGSTYYFDYWFGSESGRLLYSNSSLVTGSVTGGVHLVACYSPQRGGSCRTPGAPGFLNVSVVPAVAQLVVDGVVQTVTQGGARLAEWPGNHSVNASAPGYRPVNRSYAVTPGNTTWANLSLFGILGTIAGVVDPATALLTVNGTPLSVFPDGSFAESLPPGTYPVVASAHDYYPFTNPSVVVTSSNTTYLGIVLVGLPGWINGTVTPAAITVVTLNDQPVAVDPATGAYSVHVSPGQYWINATASGYLPASSGPLALGPLGTITVDLALVQILGTLDGVVVPSGAGVTLDGAPVATSAVGFALDLAPARYDLAASASGFDPLNLSVDIRPNQTTHVVLALNVSNGWITGSVAPAEAGLEIDGRPVSLSAVGGFNVSAQPGSHLVRAALDAYITADRNVTVSAGRATNVSLTLVPATVPGAMSPYIIPGLLLALAAVAAIALVVILRRRRAPNRRVPP